MKEKKSIVFDTGPIITLAINNLLLVLPKLKELFGGDFLITNAVKKEVIENPMSSKKFKFESLRVFKQLQDGVLTIYNKDLKDRTDRLLHFANESFVAHGKYIKIVHYGEMEVVAAAKEKGALAIVIDERTTRAMIENPLSVKQRLQRKLHTKIDVNHKNLKEFKKLTKGIKVLRSFELVILAYEHGFLNEYLLDTGHPRYDLLDGVLWSVKLSGCCVSENEIKQVLKLEKVV